MSRWKKPESEVTDGALYLREWAKTEAGIDYKKRQAEYAKEWRKRNKEKFHTSQKRCYDKIRLECLQYYSGKDIPECRCCGETLLAFLQLDHINGDGAAHRREIGMRQGVEEQTHQVKIGGNGLPYWLKKHGYPEGFQVLCANCNLGKRIGKYCPHEIERGVDMNGDPIVVEISELQVAA